ncbi:hypothetical protein RHGRI_027452 [Rhododendron griersonianum]|uniref:Uncharacterized protein n=1 Tax=Rhododendron griersonianum TaxID=479676 RepID=A0AAV6IYA8_9ERIC|nr:hypothetical protein RHGRI_027452 [Rhododendron griersonianum]
MEEYYSTPKMDDQDETEETLSFCDLSIYSSESADWDNSSKEDKSLSSSSTSSSSSDQDLFEFFSEEWSHSSTYPVQNIVFCGKLIIPFEEPELISPDTTHNLARKSPQKPRKKLANKAAKSGGKNGFCVRRLRKVLFLGSPAKWRWNLLECGLGARFPAEMELSDIRRRQRKRSPPAPLFFGGGDKKVGGGKGLWAMIKSLGGRHRSIRAVEG